MLWQYIRHPKAKPGSLLRTDSKEPIVKPVVERGQGEGMTKSVSSESLETGCLCTVRKSINLILGMTMVLGLSMSVCLSVFLFLSP